MIFCKWCNRPIFWNGMTQWSHIELKDRQECPYPVPLSKTTINLEEEE